MRSGRNKTDGAVIILFLWLIVVGTVVVVYGDVLTVEGAGDGGDVVVFWNTTLIVQCALRL